MTFCVDIKNKKYNEMISMIDWCIDNIEQKFYLSPKSEFCATSYIYTHTILSNWTLTKHEWEKINGERMFTYWPVIFFLFLTEEDAVYFKLVWK